MNRRSKCGKNSHPFLGRARLLSGLAIRRLPFSRSAMVIRNQAITMGRIGASGVSGLVALFEVP
jgi:hypothetical protein